MFASIVLNTIKQTEYNINIVVLINDLLVLHTFSTLTKNDVYSKLRVLAYILMFVCLNIQHHLTDYLLSDYNSFYSVVISQSVNADCNDCDNRSFFLLPVGNNYT